MYEAPRMTEVGTVHGLTLGKLLPGPKDDSSSWWGDPWGDPGSPNPVGSR